MVWVTYYGVVLGQILIGPTGGWAHNRKSVEMGKEPTILEVTKKIYTVGQQVTARFRYAY